MIAARKTVTVLGATGSVGRSTLDLIDRNPDRFEVLALTAQTDVSGLAAAAIRFRARLAVIGDESLEPALASALDGSGIEFAAGAAAIEEAAGIPVSLVMTAIVGSAGLRPAMAAIRASSALALANKESLVSAGSLMTDAADEEGVAILPVDSEHNAIFQCLNGEVRENATRIILTASGGPFRDWTRDQMRDVTPERAVQHPNWSMGAKISVDSATMMNKGLELIEARHLFGLPPDRYDILVHPQSIVHSLVEYRDGSVLAQLGAPDMRTPIAHALAWPDRIDTPCERLDLAALGRLDFEPPDADRFPALRVARAAMEAGGARPAILNAANEEAVAAFLAGRIGFLDIVAIVERVLGRYDPPTPASLDDVLAIDGEARTRARELMERQAA